jgi:hypothetical protein
MCLFTKTIYAGCEHSGILAKPSNTLLCERAKNFHMTSAFDATIAICHPLPAHEETRFATEHLILGHCEDCRPNHFDALDVVKQEVLEQREYAQQDFDLYHYGQDEIEERNQLYASIAEAITHARQVANNFEEAVLSTSVSRLDIQPFFLGAGSEKYGTFFLQSLEHCREWIQILDTYIKQRVPRRMFADLMLYVYKKMSRAEERVALLSALVDYIQGGTNSSDSKAVTTYLSEQLIDNVHDEGTVLSFYFPSRSSVTVVTEQALQKQSARLEKARVMRLLEITQTRREHVTARRNNRGSTPNVRAFNQDSFVKLVSMSSFQHGEKTRNAMTARMLTISIVKTTDVPVNEELLPTDGIKLEEQQATRNDLLLNHEPAKNIAIEHLEIADNDVQVREGLIHELLPTARTKHSNEACNCPLEIEGPETINQHTADESSVSDDSSPRKHARESSSAYKQPIQGFGTAFSDFGSDDTGTEQDDIPVPETPNATATNDIVQPSSPLRDPRTAPAPSLPLTRIAAVPVPGLPNSQRANSPGEKLGTIVRKRWVSELESLPPAQRTKRCEDRE